MDVIFNDLAVLFVSDAVSCPRMGLGFLQCYGANVLAHVAIAMLLSVFVFLRGWSMRWLLVPFFFLVAKEIFFDIPSSGWLFAVILDSFGDVITYPIGWAFFFWAVMSEGRK